MTGKQIRDLERIVHLIAGAGLLALAFTPLGDGTIGSALRFAVAPLLGLSGVLMWQHARVTRALRTRRGSHSPRPLGGR
jgi:hypothetical protein